MQWLKAKSIGELKKLKLIKLTDKMAYKSKEEASSFTNYKLLLSLKFK